MSSSDDGERLGAWAGVLTFKVLDGERECGTAKAAYSTRVGTAKIIATYHGPAAAPVLALYFGGDYVRSMPLEPAMDGDERTQEFTLL